MLLEMLLESQESRNILSQSSTYITPWSNEKTADREELIGSSVLH